MNRFLGAVLALAAAQAQQQEPGKGVNFYSREKEIALGQALAREFRSKLSSMCSGWVRSWPRSSPADGRTSST
jgi:hypothetical protein